MSPPRPLTIASGPSLAVVPRAVVIGAAAVALAIFPLFLGLPHDEVTAGAALPLLAWPVLGLIGTVMADRDPADPVARACIASSPVPAVLAVIALAFAPADRGAGDIGSGATTLGWYGALPLAAPALALWLSRSLGRDRRRWRHWLSVVALTGLASGAAAWQSGATSTYGALVALAVLGVGVVAAASAFAQRPRPVDEPWLDLALVVGSIGAGAASGGGVLWFARRQEIIAPEALAGVAAVAASALAAPFAVWIRREVLRRRYGPGVLSPEQLSSITPGAEGPTSARELLARAARIVAATGQLGTARILLDDAEPEPGWNAYPLHVSGQQVGTLLVRPRTADGLETRQERTIAQLLPTIALAARAVDLAVSADLARDDTMHLRLEERTRILRDLHDDLGPVLAGIGMRVEALRASHPLPELAALAGDVASCRTELRRIVADLSPSVLDEQDLGEAVSGLAALFTTDNGPRVEVLDPVPEGIAPALSAVAYRIIAEGITNAVRHSAATTITIGVRRDGDHLRVEVTDDGGAADIRPGTGLTSLRDRARQVSGGLEVIARPQGVVLSAWLPESRG